MKKSKLNYLIKVLDKSFSILEILIQQSFPMTITKINKKLKM